MRQNRVLRQQRGNSASSQQDSIGATLICHITLKSSTHVYTSATCRVLPQRQLGEHLSRPCPLLTLGGNCKQKSASVSWQRRQHSHMCLVSRDPTHCSPHTLATGPNDSTPPAPRCFAHAEAWRRNPSELCNQVCTSTLSSTNEQHDTALRNVMLSTTLSSPPKHLRLACCRHAASCLFLRCVKIVYEGRSNGETMPATSRTALVAHLICFFHTRCTSHISAMCRVPPQRQLVEHSPKSTPLSTLLITC